MSDQTTKLCCVDNIYIIVIDPSIHPSNYPSIHPFIHSFIHSSSHSLIHSYLSSVCLIQNKGLQGELLQVCKRLHEHEQAVENFQRSNYFYLSVIQLYSSRNFISLSSCVLLRLRPRPIFFIAHAHAFTSNFTAWRVVYAVAYACLYFRHIGKI